MGGGQARERERVCVNTKAVWLDMIRYSFREWGSLSRIYPYMDVCGSFMVIIKTVSDTVNVNYTLR